MRRAKIILIKVGDGNPKKMDLTATIRTLIQVVYRVICDILTSRYIIRLTLIRIYDQLMIRSWMKKKTFYEYVQCALYMYVFQSRI